MVSSPGLTPRSWVLRSPDGGFGALCRPLICMPEIAAMGQARRAPGVGRQLQIFWNSDGWPSGCVRVRRSVIVVVGIPVALDRWKERRLVVRRPTGRRLAVDELRLTAATGRAQVPGEALESHGDD